MSARAWVVAACMVLGCQPAGLAAPSAESLAPIDDDAAFAVTFPPSTADPNSATAAPVQPIEGPVPVTSAAVDAAGASLGAESGASLGTDAGSVDSTPDGACTAPLAPGDLVIDELMIESVAGAGDDGEWLEARSTLGCTVNLRGLHGECPRAAKVITFEVTSDLWLSPGAFFVVADSAVPAINHSLPDPVVVWAGRVGDVLRNKGSTISLRMNDVLIDSLTYPALKLEIGKSWAFPSDCDSSLRTDFSRWQVSAYAFFPGFAGTPNAPNDDVHCP